MTVWNVRQNEERQEMCEYMSVCESVSVRVYVCGRVCETVCVLLHECACTSVCGCKSVCLCVRVGAPKKGGKKINLNVYWSFSLLLAIFSDISCYDKHILLIQ